MRTPAELTDAFRAQGWKVTPQRQLLFGLLHDNVTHPSADALFDRFRGIVVSGDEKMLKPEARIYRLLCERYGVDPKEAVFIDDSPKNAEGAGAVGIHGIHFRSPERLERDLAALGLL